MSSRALKSLFTEPRVRDVSPLIRGRVAQMAGREHENREAQTLRSLVINKERSKSLTN